MLTGVTHGAAGMPECGQWYQGDALCQHTQQHGDLAAGGNACPLPGSLQPSPTYCREMDFCVGCGCAFLRKAFSTAVVAGECSPRMGSVSLPRFVNGLNAFFKKKKKKENKKKSLLKTACIRSLIKHSVEKP